MTKFTKHDQAMIEIFTDPAKWAAHHLGESPRWYQEEILRHPHHRKVLRCGRRIGKCIEENQRVLNPVTGEYLSVKELYEYRQEFSPDLITLNDKYQLERSQAFFIEDNGVKETFLVRTKYGAEVVLTGNHPVLTLDGWIEVDSLKTGDRIATPKALPYFGAMKMNRNELKLLAYFIGGGNLNKYQLGFVSGMPAVIEDFTESARALGCDVVQMWDDRNKLIITDRYIREVLLEHKLLDRLASEVRVPELIFQLDRDHITLFLRHLFATGGWAYTGNRPEIGYFTASKELAKDMKHLLLRFGIQSNITPKKAKANDSHHNGFQLTIHRKESILAFTSLIGIFGKEDEIEVITEQAEALKLQEHTVPKEVWKYIEEEREEKQLSKSDVTGSVKERLRYDHAPSISKIAAYADNMHSAFLFDLARADLIWEEVEAIEPQGERQTYDVFVPETHNLVCEDIMVHNTWTMTAHMLWVAFTCNGGKNIAKGATCLVATPYDSQAREIFDQLKTFIDNNPVLQDSIKSMTKNPYLIEFKNKSRIKLFTAGTRSGAEGGSMRGQKADWLYLDEMDYLSDKDFETIYAISLEAPQRIGIMAASTPTGRRGMFHKLCTQLKFTQDELVQPDANHQYDTTLYDRTVAGGWKEFYFPTMVNPEWDTGMEKELRGMYTSVAYEHEVLAEFGTEMVGVFNKDYIDEASSIAYSFLDRPTHSSPITIGVDWDKFGAATQISVVQWDPLDKRRDDLNLPEGYGRFRVINRVEIPKGEFTYDKAVDKLVELDRIYNPAFIFPDRGAGEYQIEMLRKRLGDKVKGIHLGSSYEVRDPFSRVFDKKPIKPFMVNQTTMLLERGMLRIPSPDVDEMIARQMTNYQVVKIAPKTGEPTYTSEDEHALDATMLAILAFIMEMPEIAKTLEDFQVARKFGSANMRYVDPLASIAKFGETSETVPDYIKNWDEPTPPPPRKTTLGGKKKRDGLDTWGARGSGRNSFPGRKGW